MLLRLADHQHSPVHRHQTLQPSAGLQPAPLVPCCAQDPPWQEEGPRHYAPDMRPHGPWKQLAWRHLQGRTHGIRLHRRLPAATSSKGLQEPWQAVLLCKPPKPAHSGFKANEHATAWAAHAGPEAAQQHRHGSGPACLKLCMTCRGWLPCRRCIAYRTSPRRVCRAASSLPSTDLIAGTATTPSRPVRSVTSGCSICFIASSTMVPSSTCTQHRQCSLTECITDTRKGS